MCVCGGGAGQGIPMGRGRWMPPGGGGVTNPCVHPTPKSPIWKVYLYLISRLRFQSPIVGPIIITPGTSKRIFLTDFARVANVLCFRGWLLPPPLSFFSSVIVIGYRYRYRLPDSTLCRSSTRLPFIHALGLKWFIIVNNLNDHNAISRVQHKVELYSSCILFVYNHHRIANTLYWL